MRDNVLYSLFKFTQQFNFLVVLIESWLFPNLNLLVLWWWPLEPSGAPVKFRKKIDMFS